MPFLPCRNKNLKELGIEDEQGILDLVKLKEHVRACPYCREFVFLLGMDFLDKLMSAFGRFWKVK